VILVPSGWFEVQSVDTVVIVSVADKLIGVQIIETYNVPEKPQQQHGTLFGEAPSLVSRGQARHHFVV